MMKEIKFDEKFNLRPLPKDDDSSNSGGFKKTVRLSVEIGAGLAEKIKDDVYWNRYTHQEKISEILENYYRDKVIESRPDHVKNRKPVGRKKKS